jgi:O-antigen/teichoic acid export membrane protein
MVIVYLLSVESDRLIPLIYGPNYAEATRLQPLLACTLIFTSIQHLAAFLMMSMGRMRRLLSYYLFALLLNLTLCQILIPLYSLSGAAWSILIPKGFLAGLLSLDCQRRAPFIPVKRLRELLIAASFSGILYVIGRTYFIRELAEGATLVPMIPLIWLWLRRQDGSFGPDV